MDDNAGGLHKRCGPTAFFVIFAKKSGARLFNRHIAQAVGGGGIINLAEKPQNTKREVKIMRRKKLLRQIAAAAVALSMAVSLSAPAFAAEFNLSNGGLVITANDSGITVKRDDGTSSTYGIDEEIEITGNYSSANGAMQTAEENQQEENQPVTPAKAPAKEETSEETPEAENAPAAEKKQEQKDTEAPADPEQKTETENKDNNSDPDNEEKKEQSAPANGELNASAGERQESKAEDEGQPKPEAKASAEATASASDDASNGPREAQARSSGEGERTSIIQIINNTAKKIKVSLSNAHIDLPGQAGTPTRGTAAIDIQGKGDVQITVKGDNTLSGHGYSAGIQKNADSSTGKLTITAQDTNQKLTVKEGGGGVAIGEHGAGTKNIEINNGTVVVDGVFGSNEGNATGIKITGDAVVDVTGGIQGGCKYEDLNNDNQCTTEIEISGNAQVNVKKINDSWNSQDGNIGQLSGRNEKITISGNAKVNTEGCIGGDNNDSSEYVNKSSVINISDNATVKAHGGITGKNSTVNISGNANVTVNRQIGGSSQSTSGGVTISDNAQVNGEYDGSYYIDCNLTLKDQAKIEGGCTINGTKFTDQTSDGAVLDARISDRPGNLPDHTRKFKENGEWQNVSNRLDGNCNHEEGKTYLSETIPSTCSTPGKKIYRCFYCGSVAKTEYMDCLLHTWVKGETVAPTCTQKGYTVYECSVCHETKQDDKTDPTGVHTYTEPVKTVAPTYTEMGYTVYKCQTCDATEKRDWVPMLERESTNGAPAYTVTGAETYETSVVDGRYIIAVPSKDAALNAVLGDLRAIKAQGADVVVFRTRSRESSLVIDEMLAMGTDVTPFVLAHNGSEARLTINGAVHNELIH